MDMPVSSCDRPEGVRDFHFVIQMDMRLMSFIQLKYSACICI